MDGWGIAALSVAFSIGLALGVRWMGGRPIINNVTQKVDTNTHVAGGGSGGVSRFVGGTLFPIAAIVAVVALALGLVASSIDANARVSDVAQRSIDAQKTIVQSMPEPAPVVVQPPAPVVVTTPQVTAPTFDATPIATAIVVSMLGAVVVGFGRDVIKTLWKRRTEKRHSQTPAIPLPRISLLGQAPNGESKAA